MSQIWVPPDITSICAEQAAPLTQCSKVGFMYLSLLVQLFGQSKDSVYLSDYSNAVGNGFSNAGIETSITGPTQSGPTQSLGSLGTQNYPGGTGFTPFNSDQSYVSPYGPFGSPERPFQGPTGLPGVTPFGQRFAQYETQIPLGPAPNSQNHVHQFSINHNTKTISQGPKGSHGFSESSYYLKPDILKQESGFDGKYGTTNFESSFGKYDSPLFDFESIRRSFKDIDAAATETKMMEEKKVPSVEKKKKTNSRRRRQAVEEYDFIIVGAGSAGCVVANRLSEVKNWRVLLLEAGSEEPDVTSVPALPSVLGSSSIDWGYSTQPEELTCRAQRGQTCNWFSGKVMGGSSSINYVVYMRGNKRDYDDWADLGNQGWSYREVLPYFKKSENNQNLDVNSKFHGSEGPMNVERLKYADKNVAMLVNAFNETGLPLVDFNGQNQIGTMITDTTTIDGKRVSTNVAFIRPIRYKRRNLIIKTNAQVSRVLINPEKQIAYGVKYFKNGVWYEVHAIKEIIISAGALGTPKILMLSGIGPKDDLEALNIPVIKDLSVGKNLQDHATTNAMLFKLSNKTSTIIERNQILSDMKKYFKSRQNMGPLSATGPLQMSAFIRTKFADEDSTVPDIQFHFDGRNYREFYSDPTTYLASNTLPLSYYDSINVRPILLAPRSRGYLTLNKTDPLFGSPLIYTGFFTQKKDVDTLVAALKFVTKLENTKAFNENQVFFIKEPVRACKHFKWGTYKYFACLLTRYTGTIYHPAGTCKMGPHSDKEAVVNTRLKVHGIKHLRVADASIMPNIVRGNTNAPVIMIGEKVSDMIKESWKDFMK